LAPEGSSSHGLNTAACLGGFSNAEPLTSEQLATFEAID
jgi:hypothetical protein